MDIPKELEDLRIKDLYFYMFSKVCEEYEMVEFFNFRLKGLDDFLTIELMGYRVGFEGDECEKVSIYKNDKKIDVVEINMKLLKNILISKKAKEISVKGMSFKR